MSGTGVQTPGVRLAGRGDELDRLLNRLRAVAGAGHGHVAAVTGEPGIGKTRLLREFTAAAEGDAVVLWGDATEFESRLPFGPFRAALNDHLGGLDAGDLDTLDADQRALLRGVWPKLP